MLATWQQRPPLEGLLLDEGLGLFLQAARRKSRPPYLLARPGAKAPRHSHGLTVLAPVDDAFLGEPPASGCQSHRRG